MIYFLLQGVSMNSGLIKEQAKEAFSNALAVGKKYAGELAESEDFFKPIVMAMAIKDLREALTPEAMSAVKELAGTSLGFLTDKQGDKQYDVATIRECVVEAMIRGVGVVGNQFNIIAGRFYMARNGWEAKLRKAGCTQIVPTVGKPEDIREGKANDRGFAKFTATFGAQATCIKGGQRYSVSACLSDGIDGRIEASAFGRDMSDCLPGMKGKVEARILKKLYCLACDAIESDDEGQDNVIIIEEPQKQDAAIRQQPEQKHVTETDGYHNYESGDPRAAHYATYNRLVNSILKDNADEQSAAMDFWHAIKQADSLDGLEAVRKEIAASPLSEPARAQLRKWYSSCESRLKGGAA
jgi:hypothetical protein